MLSTMFQSSTLKHLGTLCFLGFAIASAQEGQPVVHVDNSVTFRLATDRDGDVYVSGSWTNGKHKMLKDSIGFHYTTPPLASDMYRYNFEVDGVVLNDPSNMLRIRDVSTGFGYFITHGEQAALYRAGDVPHGTVAKRWYDSPTLQMTRRMTVYTPFGYENTTERFPVLYLLHGMGGDEEAWPTLGRAAQILDNLMAQGKIKPMIVVMPNGHVGNAAALGEGQYGTAFRADAGSGKMEESFADVIRFVESNYRTVGEKRARAIAGLSMGGSHSLFTAAHLNDHFDYIGLFSAAFRMNGKADSPVFAHFDENLVRQRDNGYKLYWIAMGKEDFLYQTGEEYRKKLDGIGMEYTYRESEGGHTWSNWRLYLSEFLPLLFQSEINP